MANIIEDEKMGAVSVDKLLESIEYQKTEIEKHKKMEELADKCIENQEQVIKELRSENKLLTDANEHLQDLVHAEKEKVERLYKKYVSLAKELQRARAKIDRLKDKNLELLIKVSENEKYPPLENITEEKE